jgi:hypothetical protein
MLKEVLSSLEDQTWNTVHLYGQRAGIWKLETQD